VSLTGGFTADRLPVRWQFMEPRFQADRSASHTAPV